MTVTSITSRRSHKAPLFSNSLDLAGPDLGRVPAGMSFQQLASHLETCGQFAQTLVQGLGRCCYRAQRRLQCLSPIGAVCSLRDALYLDQEVWRLTVEVGPTDESAGSESASCAPMETGLEAGLETGRPVLLSIVFKPIGAQQFVVSLAGMGERFIVRLGRPEDFQRFYEMAFQRCRLHPVEGPSPALPGWQVIEAPSSGA
jgi:hypothetical protein